MAGLFIGLLPYFYFREKNKSFKIKILKVMPGYE
tara:strand:- start:695 stop:796 length:102 start_codon:yes stop_codon:yes gene_type:complete